MAAADPIREKFGDPQANFAGLSFAPIFQIMDWIGFRFSRDGGFSHFVLLGEPSKSLPILSRRPKAGFDVLVGLHSRVIYVPPAVGSVIDVAKSNRLILQLN